MCESGSPVLPWPNSSCIHCPWSQAGVLRCLIRTDASGAVALLEEDLNLKDRVCFEMRVLGGSRGPGAGPNAFSHFL